jgi:hypothetical protein
MKRACFAFAVMVFAMAMFTTGCGSKPKPPAVVGPAAHDHSGHDHGHHHEHATGPNGGHIVELGEEQYHAEWLHDDATGKVTIILLDGEMKKEVPTAAEAATITVTIGDGEPKVYSLPAVVAAEPATEGSGTSRFELIEPALITALTIGEGATAVLSIEIEGQPYSAKIEHHAHDHGHKH